MNNPKLTNILLIVLIACNVIFFAGVHMAHHRHHSGEYMAFNHRHYGREHGSFGNFHKGFEACRGNYGGSCGSFRNRHRGMDGGCNCSNM
jgi:hypothetical protein